MENAAKALIMVGGILLAVMMISIMVFFFKKAAVTNAEYESTKNDEVLAEFNGKFEIYHRKNNTIFDIITVANLAWDNNKNGGFDSQTNIEIEINCTGVFGIDNKYVHTYNIINEDDKKAFFKYNTNAEQYVYDNSFISQFSKTKDQTDESKKNVVEYEYLFECTDIEYNQVTGKVDFMKFKVKSNN